MLPLLLLIPLLAGAGSFGAGIIASIRLRNQRTKRLAQEAQEAEDDELESNLMMLEIHFTHISEVIREIKEDGILLLLHSETARQTETRKMQDENDAYGKRMDDLARHFSGAMLIIMRLNEDDGSLELNKFFQTFRTLQDAYTLGLQEDSSLCNRVDRLKIEDPTNPF